MIDFLQGSLLSKAPDAVTVQLAGVGLRLLIPLSTYRALPPEGAGVRLLTHLHVRQDEATLFGFATELERELFRMLIAVSQIGPMVALNVLGSCQPAQLKRYVLEEDVDALKSMIKGVGEKTARRLIVELQGRMKQLPVEPELRPEGRAARDAVEALMALGESRPSAERAVRAALDRLGPDADRQQLVQQALAGTNRGDLRARN